MTTKKKFSGTRPEIGSLWKWKNDTGEGLNISLEGDDRLIQMLQEAKKNGTKVSLFLRKPEDKLKTLLATGAIDEDTFLSRKEKLPANLKYEIQLPYTKKE